LKEQISALMDDDLVLEDAEYLMTALKANGEAAKSWATYHLIGDVIRGNKVLRHDLTASIMQEIAKEPTVLAPKPSLYKSSLIKNKQVVWSVAASVAAVFFVGLVVLHQQSQEASVAPIEIAQALPAEYLRAHQSMSPSNAAYFIQPASFSQDK
jgi:sigma-E factor negative regulatory protein RseA